MVTRGKDGGGTVRESGMDVDTRLCLTWRTRKDLLHSTGNSAHRGIHRGDSLHSSECAGLYVTYRGDICIHRGDSLHSSESEGSIPGFGAGSHNAATQGLHNTTETCPSQIKKINIFTERKKPIRGELQSFPWIAANTQRLIMESWLSLGVS